VIIGRGSYAYLLMRTDIFAKNNAANNNFNNFPMVGYMVFNATSATSWRSVLLVEENGVPRENHQPVASH